MDDVRRAAQTREPLNYARQIRLVDRGQSQGSAQDLIARYTQYTLDIIFSPEHRQEIEQIVHAYAAIR